MLPLEQQKKRLTWEIDTCVIKQVMNIKGAEIEF